MRRLLWLDVETTGLNSYKNGVIQLAAIDELTKSEFVINMCPFNGCEYTKEAKAIHKKSMDEIRTYPSEYESFRHFITFLDKYKGEGKFQIAGYNTKFDMDFIIALFRRNRFNFWDYFNYYDVDVYALVKILDISGELNGKESKKLAAVCNTLDVKLKNAHDALADIKATRKLYKKIFKRYIEL